MNPVNRECLTFVVHLLEQRVVVIKTWIWSRTPNFMQLFSPVVYLKCYFGSIGEFCLIC